MTETLPLTGERTAPGIWHENYWFARHDAAYRWITAHLPIGTGRILDAGCGEGYGAELLRLAGAGRGNTVTGLDYEDTTLRHVRRVYPQVNPARGNLVRTPFKDKAFTTVTSLQTIEHLWEQPRFAAECARILAPGGTLVLSTPNRLTFPSGNWYHTRELTAAEFVELLEPHFEITHQLGLHHGARLTSWETRHGSCVDAQLAAEHDQWDDNLAGLVRATTYADFEIRPGNLDESLDLILVAQPKN
ncbi:class I SAM-dependent methyltransferase [Kribbella sindirgiensis]|uniref:Class I SAM-dependent methyltransferase n=1 Tax=Kribbella sindirgiensis TaxID=1124744 RepID=A0A4R0IFU5_9ACTN|nr:class I SAM-dependent methyltransferase [Kribbella sindirgiensis]TCC31399.1 class I SAM-dependent methyltransferase [Kribbella sindirgiensis]